MALLFLTGLAALAQWCVVVATAGAPSKEKLEEIAAAVAPKAHEVAGKCKFCPATPSYDDIVSGIQRDLKHEIKKEAPKYAKQKLNPAVHISVDAGAQTFQGWGTSLCWWANGVGQWASTGEEDTLNSLLNMVFSNFSASDMLHYAQSGTTPPSLGLTVARYNIGGSPWQPLDEPSSFYRPGAAAQSFILQDGSYNWSAEPEQRKVLAGALSRGVNSVMAFANSPPWFMTKSQSTTGMYPAEVKQAKTIPFAGPTNMDDSNISKFTDYLATVINKFATDSSMLFGQQKLVFDSISPLNEPGAWWWIYGNDQEGCRFSYEQQVQVVADMKTSLSKQNQESTVVASAEGNKALQTLRSFEHNELVADSGLLDTHGYAVLVTGAYVDWAKPLRGLEKKASDAKKGLWMSEFGTGTGPLQGGLILAKRIIVDLLELKPLAWVLWQVASLHQDLTQEGWATIATTYPPKPAAVQPRPQYYAFKQFTAFIRPGSKILGGCRLCVFSQTHAVVALLPDGSSGVIVLARLADDLPGFSELAITRPFGFHIDGYDITEVTAMYVTDPTQNCTAQKSLPKVSGGAIKNLKLTSNSITTVIVQMTSNAKTQKKYLVSPGRTYGSAATAGYQTVLLSATMCILVAGSAIGFFRSRRAQIPFEEQEPLTGM